MLHGNADVVFHDKLVDFEEDHANQKLLIKHEQYIPDDWVADLKRDKIDPDHNKFNFDGFTKLATIPTSLYEKWLREGFDVQKAPIKDVLKRLQTMDYDALICTRKTY